MIPRTAEESVVRYEVWYGELIRYTGQHPTREDAQEKADELNKFLPESKWYVKVVQV